MRRILETTLALSLAAVLAVPAVASPDDETKPVEPAAGGSLVPGDRIVGQAVEGLDTDAAKGLEGPGEAGKDAAKKAGGEVKDLLIEAKSGQVAFVVVAREDGRQYVAVPFDSVKIAPAGEGARTVRVRIAESLPGAWPEFDKEQWEDPGVRSANESLIRGWAEKEGKELGSLVRYSDLVDGDLEDPDGKDIGDVEDLMVDRDAGRISGVIASSEGLLGLGDASHLIPFDMVSVDSKKGEVKVRLTKMDLSRIRTVEPVARLDERPGRPLSGEKESEPVSPQPVMISVRLKPKAVHRYEVEAMSPDRSLVANLPGESGGETWKAIYEIRAVSVDDDGNATVSATLTPVVDGEKEEPLHYRALVTPDGEVTGVVRTDTGAMDVGKAETRVVRSHLALICGGGLTGRELARDVAFAAPAEIVTWCSPDGEVRRKVVYSIDGDPGRDSPVKVRILADDARVGHAVYDASGMLKEIVLEPEAGRKGGTLRIHVTEAESR